jgi:RHS repeat-associated protein
MEPHSNSKAAAYRYGAYASTTTKALYAKSTQPGYLPIAIGFGARYYDSGLSVWLSVDPLADKYPSMSPFMYTAGNPVMLVDPDGRWVKLCGETEYNAFINALTSFSYVTEENLWDIFNINYNKTDAPKHNYNASYLAPKEFRKRYKEITGHKLSKSEFNEMYKIHLVLVSSTMIEVLTFRSGDYTHGRSDVRETGGKRGHYNLTKDYGYDNSMNEDYLLNKMFEKHEKGASNSSLNYMYDQVDGETDQEGGYKIIPLKGIDNSTGKNYKNDIIYKHGNTLLLKNDGDDNMGQALRKGLQNVNVDDSNFK